MKGITRKSSSSSVRSEVTGAKAAVSFSVASVYKRNFLVASKTMDFLIREYEWGWQIKA